MPSMCVAVTKAPLIGGLPAGYAAQQAFFKQLIKGRNPRFDLGSIVTTISMTYDAATGHLILRW